MDCRTAQTLLFEGPERGLDTAARAEVEAHLAGCAECAAFARSIAPPDAEPAGWTRDLVRRTAGDACRRSLELLPIRVDGAIDDALDGELLDAHLEHCGSCRAVAAVLRAMERDLPQLALVEPDAAFLDEVLAQTSGRAVSSWRGRLEEWTYGLLRRPRIAWEGAYLATACLLLAVLIPGSPLAGVSQRALDLARTDPATLEQPFVALKVNLNDGAQGAWDSTQDAARTITDRASRESGEAYRKTKRDLGTLWQRVASSSVHDDTQGPRDRPANGDEE